MPPCLGSADGDAYDGAVVELPTCVRLALWVTSAWQGRVSLSTALRRSFPDVDHVEGDLSRIELWHQLGEQALFVALPRPGDVTRVPRAAAEALAHAADAGECVYAAGLGGILVPTLTEFGPSGDVGLRIAWTAYDAEPTARHRLEMIDLGQIERELLSSLRRHSTALEAAGGFPWDGRHRDAAEDALRARSWGLPAETPPRVLRVLSLAATVSSLAQLGLAGQRSSGAVDAATWDLREGLLRALVADADAALGDATNVGVMALAGWRPA